MKIRTTHPRYVVVSNEEIARSMFRIVLRVEGEFAPYVPGQFLHVKVADNIEHLLRRPISLCEFRETQQQLVLVYRASGAGTRLLSQKRPSEVIDIIGPLGTGFSVASPTSQAALLIAGGIGVPPMVELAKQITAAGGTVSSIIGFQSHEQVILVEELSNYGPVTVMTNDGSYGEKGFVTDVLTESVIESHSVYYSCGPTPMLRAVQTKLRGRMPGYLSLEERMGCGIGLCAACVHSVATPDGSIEYAKVCRKGPVFPEGEVLFQ